MKNIRIAVTHRDLSILERIKPATELIVLYVLNLSHISQQTKMNKTQLATHNTKYSNPLGKAHSLKKRLSL
jgi:hypothetical protein